MQRLRFHNHPNSRIGGVVAVSSLDPSASSSPPPASSNGTESGGLIEFGQETISIIAIVGVCVFLAVANLIVWLCGCRRHSKRNEEERQDRQNERDRFDDKQTKHGGSTAQLNKNKKKVADKPSIVKRAETGKNEKSAEEGSQRKLETKFNSEETIEEFESRVREQFSSQKVLEEIREEHHDHDNPKTPRPRSVSVELMDEAVEPASLTVEVEQRLPKPKGSRDRLEELRRTEKAPFHRNDSKVNVFNADHRIEEIDLNPALNNSINLETI
ncbi:unnamed protein product, partial [Mesorhabditis spiculigera]